MISVSQPFHNLMLGDGGALVPLVEPVRAFYKGGDGQYPNNVYGETPHSGMASELTALSLARGGPELVTVHTVVGWGGHCMIDIDKRGTGLAYPAALAETRRIAELAEAEHHPFAVGAVILTHGECDATSATYEDDVARLRDDFDRDLRAITRQTQPVVLLLSQQNSYPRDGSVALSSIAQWSVGAHHPNGVACVGPTYPYAYKSDGVHLDAASYRRLGEKYAEVFDAVVVQKRAWAPLAPASVKRDGRVITIALHVPNPPLAWDESLAPPHQGGIVEWASGRGFEALADGQPAVIASVAIEGESVVLTLRDDPGARALTVGYATIADAHHAAGGTPLGRRGQLRDSDPLVGADAETIDCVTEHGSNVVRAQSSTFAARTLRDVAEAGGLPAGTYVMDRPENEAIALSSPWEGPSGVAPITFHHDLRNYAVAFRMPVP